MNVNHFIVKGEIEGIPFISKHKLNAINLAPGDSIAVTWVYNNNTLVAVDDEPEEPEDPVIVDHKIKVIRKHHEPAVQQTPEARTHQETPQAAPRAKPLAARCDSFKQIF